MAFTVLFFGATADLTGRRQIDLDLEAGATVGRVLETVRQSHSGLSKHRLLVALNEEYVSLETAVHDGDTLAVFTAVSGG
jgi:Molybdopterin converting factor, small subunit